MIKWRECFLDLLEVLWRSGLLILIFELMIEIDFNVDEEDGVGFFYIENGFYYFIYLFV